MGLDTVEIVMDFENAFGIEISNEAAEKLKTPRDVREFVMNIYADRGVQADSDTVFEEIRRITSRYVSVKDQDRITLDSRFTDDLGLD